MAEQTVSMKANKEWYKELLPLYEKKLEIIHFNDCYNVEERENEKDTDDPEKDPYELRIKGGVPRFVNALKVFGHEEKLVAFSGDLFFPSRMSSMFDGDQMV